MSIGSGKLFLELACWGVGLLLIAVYFGATIGFENERREGIDLFAQAQAAAGYPGNSGSNAAASQSVDQQPQTVAQTNERTDDGHDTPGQTETDPNDSFPVALLRMPGVGLEVPVFDDISERNLSRGAGWVPGTAMPNDGGNMAIAAHRDQYFRALKDVAVGDLLELEGLSGQRDYKVASITIVEPEDLWPLDPAEVDTVTLITCYPFYFIGSAPKRYIVQAVAID